MLKVQKGITIARFLAAVKAQLSATDFPELRATSADSLLYVKEDLIIPSVMSYDDHDTANCNDLFVCVCVRVRDST